MTPDSSTTDIPKWLVHGPQDETENFENVLLWAGAGNSDFRVTVPKLRSLLEDGFRPVTRYKFTVDGLPGTPIPATQWCKNLGRDVHARIDELEIAPDNKKLLRLRAAQVGNVFNWADGFDGLLDYLDAAAEFTGIDLNALVVEGIPGNALLAASGYSADDEAPHQTTDTSQTISGTAKQIHELLRSELNVIVTGVAGSGKSHLLESLRTEYEDVETVVFHPSTSYEEFVVGLRPGVDGAFRGSAGVFVEACQRAAAKPERAVLFFIDEINRANTSRVFGDLLLPLEKSKRHAFRDSELKSALLAERPDDVTAVRLQTPITRDESGNPLDQELRYLVIPENVHILGAMNSTDRSVGTIDLALRRRFMWHELEPLSLESLRLDPMLVEKLGDGRSKTGTGSVCEDWNTVAQWYGSVNEVLLERAGPDARLGHAYIYTASTPLAAAHGLMEQLAEVVFVFNIPEKDVGDIPELELARGTTSLRIEFEGAGFGRRPRVRSPQRVTAAEQGS